MNRYQPSCRQLLKSTLISHPLLPASQVSLHGFLLGILHVGLTISMDTNCLLPAYCSTFSAQDELSSQVDLFFSKHQTFQPPRFIQLETTYDCLSNVAKYLYPRYCVSILSTFVFLSRAMHVAEKTVYSLILVCFYDPSTQRPWRMTHTSRHIFTRSCDRIYFTIWMHGSWKESSLTAPKSLMPEMVVSKYVEVSCNFPLFLYP